MCHVCVGERTRMKRTRTPRGVVLAQVSSSAAPDTTKAKRSTKRKASTKEKKGELYSGLLPGCPEPLGATFSGDMVCVSFLY